MSFTWSISRLLTYLGCPYAYFLKYKEKVEVPTPWYLVFGRAVHKAIEICHKGNPHQKFTPSKERPLFFKNPKAFGGFWLGLWERELEKAGEIQWTHQDQKEQLKGLGWALLAGTKDDRYKGYYHCILNPPFDMEILEVEYRINTKLWEFPFFGIIDQLWRTAEGTVLIDITTGRAKSAKYLQITAYDQCLRAVISQNPQEKARFGKPEDIRHFVWNLRSETLIPNPPQDPQELRKALEFTAAGIQDGIFLKTQQDTRCRYCQYREICGKTVGEPISAAGARNTEINMPTRNPGPKIRQHYFKKGAEGGWFRGDQVKGKT